MKPTCGTDGVPVTFRVYPRESRRGLYVRVRVFRTDQQMRGALNREELCRHHRHTRGVCQTLEIRDGRTWRLSPWFATVNLSLQNLGSGTVAHEFGHAIFAWAKRKRIDPTSGMESEEIALYGLTFMVRQFVNMASDRGLYE